MPTLDIFLMNLCTWSSRKLVMSEDGRNFQDQEPWWTRVPAWKKQNDIGYLPLVSGFRTGSGFISFSTWNVSLACSVLHLTFSNQFLQCWIWGSILGTVKSVKNTLFSVVTPCSSVSVHQYHSKMSANCYQSAWYYLIQPRRTYSLIQPNFTHCYKCIFFIHHTHACICTLKPAKNNF
jgi:hypothetical protein